MADAAAKLGAARQLTRYAADRIDADQRCDLEAGTAKLFASETAVQIAPDAVRIQGGCGYSTEFPIERCFRDAPLMLVGEGTNEIQRNMIVDSWSRGTPASMSIMKLRKPAEVAIANAPNHGGAP